MFLLVVSYWQPRSDHLFPEFARTGGIEGIVEQRTNLRRLRFKLFDNLLYVIAVARKGWLQIINVPRQNGADNVHRDRPFAGLVSRLKRQG